MLRQIGFLLSIVILGGLCSIGTMALAVGLHAPNSHVTAMVCGNVGMFMGLAIIGAFRKP